MRRLILAKGESSLAITSRVGYSILQLDSRPGLLSAGVTFFRGNDAGFEWAAAHRHSGQATHASESRLPLQFARRFCSRKRFVLAAITLLLLSVSTPAAAETLDCEVAEWVIRLGGSVVTTGPQPRVMADLADLLQQDFRLNTMNLVGTNINPPDLERLAELTPLKPLYLPSPIFNPNAGNHPDHNPHMRQLHLALTEVSGKSLDPFRRLRFLDLSVTPVDDAGIKNLYGRVGLSKLYLHDTQVTNEGMEKLKQPNHLASPDLRYTRTTRAGTASLQAALPDSQADFVDFARRPIGKVPTATLPVGKGEKVVAGWIQAMVGKAVCADGAIQKVSLWSLSGTPWARRAFSPSPS
ncbi:MAG: hypothetical protein EXQ58_01465 [Acidobacteria bacterium]|nr:hypothetical protein [Acidobacteriota bacterium]